MLLSKGFEVEMYTGTPQGDIVGLSDKIVSDLDGFVREPDSRNVEYTTAPLCSYDRLLCALVKPRRQLRAYLKQLGDYTILPGSTLSLGGSDRFFRSDPNNPYHTYIEQTYGTKVVTASIHINIGIAQPELLMQAIRLIRVEAPLYLALSASSPFLDGAVTGYHSTRWGLFPKTPAIVPLFESHRHFINWTEEQLVAGTMQNVRHLWSSVRPNGDRRPYNLNRAEMRICDLVTNPISLLAIAALLEARLWQMLADPSLDPLEISTLPATTRNQDLIALTEANEAAASKLSLDATLRHWQDGRKILARDWIEEIYQQVWPIAKQRGFSCFLSPLKKILREGNEAQQWLKMYHTCLDSRSVIIEGIQSMREQERELEDKLCQQLVA
ncbi:MULTISPECIES: glutamate--cysteine ligase [Kamptonema]|uniref:glutamate--cysteine ligase n=1 Tax=Kamptonema TaxID=1501433 RepID=UPI0001DAC7D5|nr:MULTISPECIES: glutamate--cysteine ligase [Kamptonema]CBN54386.1 putative glutamate--cysteine ligase [Kamptonema sp. PCC 6506]